VVLSRLLNGVSSAHPRPRRGGGRNALPRQHRRAHASTNDARAGQAHRYLRPSCPPSWCRHGARSRATPCKRAGGRAGGGPVSRTRTRAARAMTATHAVRVRNERCDQVSPTSDVSVQHPCEHAGGRGRTCHTSASRLPHRPSPAGQSSSHVDCVSFLLVFLLRRHACSSGAVPACERACVVPAAAAAAAGVAAGAAAGASPRCAKASEHTTAPTPSPSQDPPTPNPSAQMTSLRHRPNPSACPCS